MTLIYAFSVLTCLFVLGANGQNSPRFLNDMNGFVISETASVGDMVYTLRARYDGAGGLTFGIEAAMFEIREPGTGQVYLKQQLDFEAMDNPLLLVKVWVIGGGQRVDKEVTVSVEDANDEIPRFNLQTYDTSIPESTSVGSIVVREIEVTDADRLRSSRNLEVKCDDRAAGQAVNVCAMFGLTIIERSSRLWRGHLVLMETVDFEQLSNPVLHIPILATDGLNSVRKTITVTILDINDTPPVILSSLSAVINESSRAGIEVLKVVAVDGDKGEKRKIVYEIVTNEFDLFRIDETSGLITTKQPLDREDPKLVAGFLMLEVKAKEVIDATHVGDDALTSTITAITVTILDINDNPPVFPINRYRVKIPENILDGTPLPNLSLLITDADQGMNAEFELSLENHNDIFSISPKKGSKSITASIFVTDSKDIDYDLGDTEYVIHVIARETKTAERKFGDTYVIVVITDVNDNKPKFSADSYTADVSETATAGTPVIRITATDIDSRLYGTASIRYKLTGNGADRFLTDHITGDITVAACSSPGSGNCLDREQQDTYHLSMWAGDKDGEGNLVSVPLTITVIDENDNPPRLALTDYLSYIDEGLTSPSPDIQVQATDADSSLNGNNRLLYSIVGGNAGNLWQIGRESGVVTARRPVDYEATPAGQGFYVLTVQAADPDHTVTAQVKIIVIDANDHRPYFTQNGFYEQYISEETKPGTVVETVRATDADAGSGPNGQVEYRIATGAQDKFTINIMTGVIKVAPETTFDYDVQKKYEMIVIANDKGQPRKSATANVIVNIRDANNKDPYFVPSTVRTDVYENATIGQVVIEMQARDPDSDASLIYYMEEPKQAFNPQGNVVDPAQYDYRNLFTIERRTGVVRVNRSLEHDRVAVLSSTIKAVDTSGMAAQSAIATLIINILEVNTEGPVFGPPWTPSRPRLDLTVREEMAVNSYVTTIVASDPPTDAISKYTLFNNDAGFFKIEPKTGVVTVARRVDYEKVQTFNFVVTAADSGQPRLTSTATVYVRIQNINDENPIFGQAVYKATIPENSAANTPVIVIKASDLDLGDFGLVRYSLTDERFQIDSISGQMSVAAGAVLDRETSDEITVTVTARDSPNNPSVSRFALAQVQVTLTDVNDNTPGAGEDTYLAVVEESADPDTPVVRLSASDGDIGENAKIFFRITGGNSDGLFVVNATSGVVSTRADLKGWAGAHNLTVEVRDGGSPSLRSTTTVLITVLEGNNGAPIWDYPTDNNATVTIIENQYLGMTVTTVVAHDDDKGQNGVVTYGFYHKTLFQYETDEFTINRFTGVISARRLFDYEEKNSYVLHLVARDSGRAPLESTQYLTVRILDADDHDPEFNQFKNCCAIPYHIYAPESTKVGALLGNVSATDKDSGKNAKITYHIQSGNSGGKFRLDADSGALYLKERLQFEEQTLYRLSVGARDLQKNYASLRPPHCLCRSAAVVIVFVHVSDLNEFPPVFTHNLFNSCIALTAPVGKLVTVMMASDLDTRSSDGISYSITALEKHDLDNDKTTSSNTDTFLIGVTNGTVVTNSLMAKYKDHYFKASVMAADKGRRNSSTDLRIWVTTSTSEITITFSRPPREIQSDLPDIIRKISQLTKGGIVCISDLRYHVDVNNVVKVSWTDLVLHVIDNNTLILINGDVLVTTLKGKPAIAGLLIEDIVAGSWLWGGFIIDPVVAAIVIIAILLLLALMLLCCFFCCCASVFERFYAHKYPEMFNIARINPVYGMASKFYTEQELSMNMGIEMDNLAFERDQLDGGMGAQLASGKARLVIPGGGGEQTVTETVTTRQYQVSQQQQSGMSQHASGQGGGAGGGGDPRIVAGLESGGQWSSGGQTGIYVDRTQGGSYEATFGSVRQPVSTQKAMSTIGTMTTDGMPGGMANGTLGGIGTGATSGFSYAGTMSGPSPFGAILTRSEGNLAQRLHSSHTDLSVFTPATFVRADPPTFIRADPPTYVRADPPTFIPAAHGGSRVYSTESSGPPTRFYSNGGSYVSRDDLQPSPQISYEPVFLSDGFPNDIRVQQHVRENTYSRGAGYLSS